MRSRSVSEPVEVVTPSVAGPTVRTCVLLLSTHFVLGVVGSDSGAIITAHAVGSSIVAIWLVATTSNIEVVLTCATYVAGSEVFWRLPGSRAPWMWGTYLAIVVLLVGWYRLVRGKVRLVPLAYLACLTPSVALILSADIGLVRDRISFNLAGPALLGVSVIVCSWVRSSQDAADQLLWWLVAATRPRRTACARRSR